ncbi:MAG TPA: HEAT repeat domain-containing protein [Gemmatimonadaceae bacterium]|nr:HEAT repeat domain-containing protein [Gemmatimonadaceae bacterium]
MTELQAVPEESSIPLAPVSEVLKLFARAVRAHQLYLPNNPMHTKALAAVRGAFEDVWAHTDLLALTVTESQFRCEGHVVLEETGRGSESLPWLFYKDGIRSFGMSPGFENGDLDRLLDIIQRARSQVADDDDLLSLLWEEDLPHFQYQFVDLAAEGSTVAPGAELLTGGVPTGTIAAPVEVETGGEAVVAGGDAEPRESSQFARMENYDTTMYFLEPAEIEYLQAAIRDDFDADLRPSVVAALLDTFEQEEEAVVREEICGVLETLLLSLLTAGQYRSAAYLLHETAAAVSRSGALLPSQGERLLSLADRMSEPAVLTQVLQALEDSAIKPAQEDLDQLFAQLKPSALGPLLMQLSRTQNAELRTLLESAAARLSMHHSADLLALIASDDPGTALEAVRRAGALRSPVAVSPLAKLLGDTDATLRRAAAMALVEIGSAGAMQALERAVADDDRETRIIAVRAMADRQHRASLSRVERTLKERILQEPYNAAEKTAFFDAYVALAGEGAIALLDGILTPKGFLSKKEDPQTRACAAVALGKLGTARALDALRRAASDKDIVVRTAASRALRGNA